MKSYTIDEIRNVLINTAFNLNAHKPKSGRLSASYPNEVLLELVGKEHLDTYWISEDEIAENETHGDSK